MSNREFSGWRRPLPWLLGGAALVLLSWALAWGVLPGLLKGMLERQVSGVLGRQIGVQRVDIRPWSLQLELKGLTLGAAEGKGAARPQLEIASLFLDASIESVWRMAPVIDAVQVQGVALRVRHLGGGRFDFDDMVRRLSRPAAEEGKPLSFALHNLRVADVAIDFDDAEKGLQHTVRELSISLPFLSNMASSREVLVEPHLAFRLNGTAFDSRAQARPFAQTRQGSLSLKVEGLDLLPWLPYLGTALPVQIDSARLSADLQAEFVQGPSHSLRLSGTVALDKARVRSGAVTGVAGELLALERLMLDVADLRPLERRGRLRAIELSAPSVMVARDKKGQLNLEQLAAAFSAPAAPSRPAAAGSDSGGWVVEIDRLALKSGQVRWHDQIPRAAVRWVVRDINAEVTAVKLPFDQPSRFRLDARLDQDKPLAAGRLQSVSLKAQGSATDRLAQAEAEVSEFPLQWLEPYLSNLLEPSLQGRLSASLGLDWQASVAGEAPEKLNLNVKQASVKALALQQGSTRWLGAQVLQVSGVQADLRAQRLSIAGIALRQPALELRRDNAGRWMFDSWQRTGQIAQKGPRNPGPDKPWSVQLKDFQLEDGAVNLQDSLPAQPVRLGLKRLALRVQDFSTEGLRPVRMEGSVQLQSGTQEPGQLRWRGKGKPNPLAADLELDASRLPLHALQPYLADRLRVEVLRADAGFKGTVAYQQLKAGPRVSAAGDLALEDLRVHTRAEKQAQSATGGAGGGGLRLGEELLRWKVLSLRGLEVNLEPEAAARVNVRETVLSDFYARLVLDEAGRLNLQGLLAAQEGAPPPAGSTPAPVPPVAAAPLIRMGPISLTGGQVDFSDRFIKPNYSARLSELTGRLGAFSSQPQTGEPALADVSLRGRAQGTATLEIDGRINPLASPLALDLKARVRELELAPLSAYSVRHAGHGIERGKLSVDLAYLVRPDGKLEASNRIILNQLTFGDKVDNAPTSLPVKLAVALLADRHGVIDVDLPVSGSLNDPEFRLAPLIFKIIGNLIVKAVTAPFSLIAKALGGGDELSKVAFSPGSAELSLQAQAGLDKVVDALGQRPALQMTVSGTASLEAEREGYLRQQLHGLLLAERRRAEVLAGQTPTPDQPIDPATPVYAELLKAVYARADIPRPRLADGSLQALPTAEMENLLLSHLSADEEAMRQLAVRRGVAVRDYLASRQVPLERLFLGTAKVVAAEEKWAPRAELTLATP